MILRSLQVRLLDKLFEDNPRESRKEWLLNEFTKSDGFRFWRGDNKPIELWSNHVIDYSGDKGLLAIEVVY